MIAIISAAFQSRFFVLDIAIWILSPSVSGESLNRLHLEQRLLEAEECLKRERSLLSSSKEKAAVVEKQLAEAVFRLTTEGDGALKLKKTNADLMAALAERDQEMESLKETHHALQAKLQSFENEQSLRQVNIDALESEKAQITSKMDWAARETDRLKQTIASLQAENQTLQVLLRQASFFFIHS